MKKKIALLVTGLALTVTLLSGCQWTAKHFGGSYTVKLEQGQKLDMLTWKDNDLWILTRPMRPGEEAETYKFHEDSNWNLLEGTVTLIESK